MTYYLSLLEVRPDIYDELGLIKLAEFSAIDLMEQPGVTARVYDRPNETESFTVIVIDMNYGKAG